MSTQATAINFAACLRDVTHIGYTLVVNVCTGAETVVPWGPFAWLGLAVIVAVITVPAAFWVWLNWPLWRMRWNRRRAGL
jgi:hypothetical protein